MQKVNSQEFIRKLLIDYIVRGIILNTSMLYKIKAKIKGTTCRPAAKEFEHRCLKQVKKVK